MIRKITELRKVKQRCQEKCTKPERVMMIATKETSPTKNREKSEKENLVSTKEREQGEQM